MIDTASVLLNTHGAQGFRRADVAKVLKLDTSTLSYYFKKRDDLVGACLERTIEWIDQKAREAAKHPDQASRSEAYLQDNLQLLVDQRLGQSVPLPVLSDLATLSDPIRERLETQLAEAFAVVADFHPDATEPADRIHRRLCANLLLNIIFWMPAWDERYRVDDFLALGPRMADLLSNGLLSSGDAPPEELVSLEPEPEDHARQDYLKAATRLINRYGYKGARVDMIAADLGLSTGSFYHHLKTKDELVLAAFDRTFTILETALDLAKAEASAGARIARFSRLVAHHQICAEVPLLRASSYQALPADLRDDTFRRTDQLIQYLATQIADGIADGSVRPTDPLMAAQCLFATLTGLSGMSRWIKQDYPDLALNQYMMMLAHGIYTS